jgi:hypothetical protein
MPGSFSLMRAGLMPHTRVSYSAYTPDYRSCHWNKAEWREFFEHVIAAGYFPCFPFTIRYQVVCKLAEVTTPALPSDEVVLVFDQPRIDITSLSTRIISELWENMVFHFAFNGYPIPIVVVDFALTRDKMGASRLMFFFVTCPVDIDGVIYTETVLSVVTLDNTFTGVYSAYVEMPHFTIDKMMCRTLRSLSVKSVYGWDVPPMNFDITTFQSR